MHSGTMVGKPEVMLLRVAGQYDGEPTGTCIQRPPCTRSQSELLRMIDEQTRTANAQDDYALDTSCTFARIDEPLLFSVNYGTKSSP